MIIPNSRPFNAPRNLSEDQQDLVTIIIPSYNEADCIPVLLDRIECAMANFPELPYEIVFVDDGSTDATPKVLEQSCGMRPNVGFLRLMRNFGHQAALSAGLMQARGTAVVTMDSDLQHPAELLPQMIDRWLSGYDVVQAIRRSQPGFRKSLASRLFYRLLNLISDVEVQDGAADFRLMSRRALKTLLELPEQSQFVRGLVAWMGYPSTTIEFDADARYAGKSRYTSRKMIGLAVDAVINLSDRPLSLALYLAAVTLLAMFSYVLYLIFQFSNGVQPVKGWTSTILLILGIGSVQLFSVGILGLYVKEILKGIRRRPNYLVAQYQPPGLEPGVPISPPSVKGADLSAKTGIDVHPGQSQSTLA